MNSHLSRSDFVNKRSINDWSVRSYRDPITAPPTPFPPRFTVPTRPNQANVPERQKIQPPPPTLPPDVQPPPPTLPPPTIPPSRPTMRPTFPPSVESPTPRNPIVFPSQEQECLSAMPNIGRRGNARPWRQRRKRFALEGSQWPTRLVTYTVTKYPPNISKEKVDAILQQAFNTWQQAADISFSQQNGGDANIEIRLVTWTILFFKYIFSVTHSSSNLLFFLRFEEGSHGDGQPFDGAQV